MRESITIALIIGSLRKDSINRKFAEYVVSQMPSGVTINEVNIADLPLYNQDYDGTTIDSYERVRQQLKAADAVLIVTPEHNRTMPAALKNVIDIASRPYKQSIWTDKKVAVMTASPSSYGGINSGLDVRKSMQMLSAQMMIRPEVHLSRATDSLNEDGSVSERTQKYLQKFVEAFVDFVASADSRDADSNNVGRTGA
ncbi:NADPH-dependent FMN reductase [Psychrobacter celer]|uniref:NADPH-dependent FMN reductase n=1 Tax=Psychrobacter celer TaxID=306572 RepID=UPI003FD69BAB